VKATRTRSVRSVRHLGAAFLPLEPPAQHRPRQQRHLGAYEFATRAAPGPTAALLPTVRRPDAAGSREAALRTHLMVRRNYEVLVSGDGACAGCGEKGVLRAIASATEAMMRPVFHREAERLKSKAARLQQDGGARLAALAQRAPQEHALFVRTAAHAVLRLARRFG
jgi:pyruvate-ferredoxin/flavodoxin oxidoreductase